MVNGEADLVLKKKSAISLMSSRELFITNTAIQVSSLRKWLNKVPADYFKLGKICITQILSVSTQTSCTAQIEARGNTYSRE